MNAADIRSFVARDRTEVETSRRDYWARRFRAEGPRATLAAAQALREHVRRIRPGWPDASERAEDLAHHLEQRALLDLAARALTRR